MQVHRFGVAEGRTGLWRDNLDERFAANRMAIFAVAAE